MKKILFRADASPKIGSGHLLRSVALAQALKLEGAEICFSTFCAWEHLVSYLKEQGFEVKLIPIVESELGGEKDLKHFLNEVNSGYGWVVLDNYHFDTQYQKEVKNTGVHLLMIDDIADRKFCCDLLVNHGLQANAEDYDSEGKLLLGTEYALIRQELLKGKAKKSWNEEPKNILIILGGSGNQDVFEKIVSGIKSANLKNVRIKALTGFSDLNIAGCEIVKATLNPSDVYCWADIAITAGGGTTWELSYYGVPGIIGIVTDNQVGVVEAVNNAGIFQSIGWYKDCSIEKIGNALKNLFEDSKKFNDMREKALKLVDGNGTKRIIQAIREVEREYTSSRK